MTTIKFSKPIVHEGKTYESIDVDEPTIAATAAYEKAAKEGGETEAAIAMLAADSIIPIEALRRMKVSDFRKCMEVIEAFTVAQTGDDGAKNTGAPSAPTSPTS